jgi:DNA-binding GntR family transcriptional regulator
MIDVRPLNTRIELELKKGIVDGSLQPGQRLSIEELAATWHVSSTPVRDALRRLEAGGFVTVSPRKSVYVATLDAQAFKEIFDLRVALECLAVELALPHIAQDEIDALIAQYEKAYIAMKERGSLAEFKEADPLLHDLFLSRSGNRKLVEIMDGLSDLITWARNIIVRQRESYVDAYPEHMAVLAAARAGDAASAQEAMRTHLRNSCNRTLVHWDLLSDAD